MVISKYFGSSLTFHRYFIWYIQYCTLQKEIFLLTLTISLISVIFLHYYQVLSDLQHLFGFLFVNFHFEISYLSSPITDFVSSLRNFIKLLQLEFGNFILLFVDYLGSVIAISNVVHIIYSRFEVGHLLEFQKFTLLKNWHCSGSTLSFVIWYLTPLQNNYSDSF